MKIAITGHRPNKLGNDYNLTSPLIIRIQAQLQAIIGQYKPDVLISGMALGIDTLWAKMAHMNEIELIAAIPCLDQDIMWPNRSRSLYHGLLSHPLTASKIITNTSYTKECMQVRNIWMVDNCDILVAVWDGSEGGTANCVKYAKSINKQIIRINPDDYKYYLIK